MFLFEQFWSRWAVIQSFAKLLYTSVVYGSGIRTVSSEFASIKGTPSNASFSIWGVLYFGLGLHVCFGNIKNSTKLSDIFDAESSWIVAFSRKDFAMAKLHITQAKKDATLYAIQEKETNVHLMHAEWLQVATLLQSAIEKKLETILPDLEELVDGTDGASLVYQWALWGILDNWDFSSGEDKTNFLEFGKVIMRLGYSIRGQQSQFTLFRALF
jgi:hypothetical protein